MGWFALGTSTCMYTMADNNTQKKKPHWTSLEIGLLTIVSLLFVIIVALIILFITQSGKGECMRFFVLLCDRNTGSAAFKLPFPLWSI
uniref:Uncharacterized protein n=1 Tax=Sinocyclocheilus anshuiensis TaxID=1608454 RepID=A0A671QN25_9TELE